VKVIMHQRFGKVLSKNEKARALRSETIDESVAGGGSRSVKAVAISLAGMRRRCHLDSNVIC
jgi:hypothetical protein